MKQKMVLSMNLLKLPLDYYNEMKFKFIKQEKLMIPSLKEKLKNYQVPPC